MSFLIVLVVREQDQNWILKIWRKNLPQLLGIASSVFTSSSRLYSCLDLIHLQGWNKRIMSNVKMTEHVLYVLFILYFCLNIYMCTMFMPSAFQGQKKVLKLWNWNYKFLWVTICILEPELRCSTRETCPIKHQTHHSNSKKNTFQNGVGNLLKWHFIVILRYCFKELPHTSFDPKHLSDWYYDLHCLTVKTLSCHNLLCMTISFHHIFIRQMWTLNFLIEKWGARDLIFSNCY